MSTDAVEQMLAQGFLQPVTAADLDAFLAPDGLAVLFFTGGEGQRGNAHDVAVALREVLKEYPGQVRAGLVAAADEAALQPRFRVEVLPSLALVLKGGTLEVIPRVRDWADYSRAFARYLGRPVDLRAME